MVLDLIGPSSATAQGWCMRVRCACYALMSACALARMLAGGDYELRSLPLLKPKTGHFAHVLNSGFLYQ